MRRRKKQRECFHHDIHSGTSWIRSQLIEMGMRKLFWCSLCHQTWFL